VSLTQYGTSYQRRPLIALTITSEANHANLSEILENNRALAEPEETSDAEARRIMESNPAIVWLSFNVHGNEAAISEAALITAYALAAAENESVSSWLEETVVVIDPCLNPDGRERYVAFFDNELGVEPDTNPSSSEHREPWPSGRSNHYMFDLNRDWVWQSQVESASRVGLYRQYMPQLHIDNHEQGYNSPFFFGPGDTPYSTNIPQQIRDWLDVYGDGNEAVFDALGLPYATRERFDYLYPGYGKVLPVYHGAVGLLVEQAGHGRGGLAINVDAAAGPDPEGGYTLTLRERIRNVFLVNMSYVQTTAENRRGQLERFRAFFEDANGPREPLVLPDTAMPGETVELPMPTAYVIDAGNDPGKLRELHGLLASHGIEVEVLERGLPGERALSYFPPFVSDAGAELAAGSWVVRASQPMGYLARTLLDRATYVEDVGTYDITAWSVPLMLALDAHEYFGDAGGLRTRSFDAERDLPALVGQRAFESGADRPVAWAVPSDRLRFTRALSLAADHGVFARLLDEPVGTRGDAGFLPSGSLLVHTVRNTEETLNAYLSSLASADVPAFAIGSGDPQPGTPLGNNANRRFVHPRVMLLTGSPLSSLSAGHTWHMLDRQFKIRHHRVRVEHFPPSDLSMYNTIVLPDAWGSLNGAMSSSDKEALERWVRSGGTLIAMGRSADWASEELLGLGEDSEDLGSPARRDDYSGAEEDDADGEDDDLSLLTWEEREHRGNARRIPGALLAATVDTTHPLAFGIDERLAFHVFDPRPLRVSKSGYVVARFGETGVEAGAWDDADETAHPHDLAPFSVSHVRELYRAAAAGELGEIEEPGSLVLSGWISAPNAAELAGTPAVTHHRLGGGGVICFASDPTNRAMNHAGMRLLTNAITLGPSMSRRLQPLGDDGVEVDSENVGR
jgi:hypothetical protein